MPETLQVGLAGGGLRSAARRGKHGSLEHSEWYLGID